MTRFLELVMKVFEPIENTLGRCDPFTAAGFWLLENNATYFFVDINSKGEVECVLNRAGVVFWGWQQCEDITKMMFATSKNDERKVSVLLSKNNIGWS